MDSVIMFTDADRALIKQAVERAEAGTSGEIVPMVVASSARYREAGFRTGLVLAWLTLAVLLTLELAWLPWGWHAGNAGLLLLCVVAAYGIGEWLGRFPSVIRLVVSRDRMAQKVRLRAEQAFYQQSLHRTRAGTGILILISLLERQVQVLADRGINERVPPGTWDRLVHGMIDGIHQGRPTEAICEAIQRCGDFLAEVAPSRPGENPNELPDQLREDR
jgi:putative membrane protein